ncbi:flagellar basal body L-ring protein FlgH [Polynucleobacter aenigmaticus]|uniref:flagellar basal body L-ring protein FlgH n=1 Tax=Polynucleobacter aenigmaticus TaxID=1743164 RepID=UPI001F0AC96B|nr:flagellar basal body L-ring protein FlgH [Polynucleobacter aenigmaticus]
MSAYLICGLSACSITPSTITQNPGTSKVTNYELPPPNPGSIYSSASYRPMFEGRRARMVGDVLTITINENTAASKDGGGSASKKGAANSAFSNMFGTTIEPTFKTSNDSGYEAKAANNTSNTFNGYITATVIDVRPNGHLVVTGEKQVAFDQGIEFVRFSGVVNPDMITTGNSVSSNTIADARFEYRTNTTLDLANIGSMLNRFFLSIVPF